MNELHEGQVKEQMDERQEGGMQQVLFPLRLRLVIRVIVFWGIGLTLTFWPLLWIASGFLRPNFSPQRVRELTHQWQMGIATVVAVYFGLAIFSIFKTVRADRLWFKKWKEVERSNFFNEFKWAEGGDPDDPAEHEIEALFNNIPKHPGLAWMKANCTQITISTPKGEGEAMATICEVMGRALARLRTIGLPYLTVAASPLYDALLVQAPVLMNEYLCAYATVALDFKIHGQTLVISSSGSSFYVCTKGFFNSSGERIRSDVAYNARNFSPFWEYACPFLCLKHLPEFIISLFYLYPFTTRFVRKHLNLATGLLGEHRFINNAGDERPWRLNAGTAGHLEEVLRVVLGCFSTNLVEIRNGRS